MKFGSTLKDTLYSDWKFYYIDYDGLKSLLKGPEEEYTEKNEVDFVEFLEKELEKVAAFQTIKLGEINRRIQHCENKVKSLAQNSYATPEQYQEVEQDINSVIPQVNELAKFSRMNYTGFIKIIKKHDKYTPYTLRPMFMVRINSKSIFKENFDSLLLQLSRLYDIVRNRGVVKYTNGVGAPEGASSTTRRTIKYWVHPDNVMELKLYVLKYLPVLVYASNSNANGSVEPRISTVYYDNENFDLYNERVEKKENSSIIRFRWYGDEDANEIFVERKVHREDWMGEANSKERLMVKHKYINGYFQGENVLDYVFEKQRNQPEANLERIEKDEEFSKEIQLAITERHLKPILRTFYNRTTFQLPGDSTVTISLDTEVAMIREDNFDETRSGDQWRRPNIGTKFPFTNLSDHDVTLFPFAVLEVKLEILSGSSTPKWVDHLINSHLVEPVPNFSKYIHGVATLLDNRVSLLPFWLPQIEKNIRRPPSSNFNLASPLYQSQEGSSRYTSSQSLSTGSANSQSNDTRIDIDGPRNRFSQSKPTDERSPLISRANGTNYSNQPVNGHSSSTRGDTSSNPFKSFFSSSKQADTIVRPSRTPNKRIALPVRVEPKVFFANERTFLSWLNFTLLLGSLALGLLNFGDRIGQISGLIFTLISIFVMIYSLYIYQWRAEMIRRREAGPYDDRVGPIVLVGIIFTAVIINFWLRFSQLADSIPTGKLF